ncbi:MAG: helix-turn-helix transcriptional regulator [Clostridia bacterium]|nr:helix-turn-helix transcriptional regulator [Clostridia bacterium]
MNLNNLTITEISGVCTPVYETKRCNINIKNRPWYGISFAIDGEISYSHEGKTYISDKKHVIFHPKGATYTLDCYKPGSFAVINFQCADSFVQKNFVSIPIDDNERFISLHSQLEKITLFNSTENNLEKFSLLYKIFSCLFNDINKNKICPVLKPAAKYIEEHINEQELSIKVLAELCHLSESYFRRLFKSNFGFSPKQYILDVRIKKAKTLLESGNDKLLNVADQCGFSNLYYFLRVFKEKNGCTPTEYRKLFYKEIL